MPRIDPLPKNLSPDALLRSLGITEPRDIDVEAIAYYVGLRIKRRCLNCCEAMITGRGNKGIISVVPGGMPQRERFSIAHELGHWAQHRGETIACRSSDIGKFSNKNEQERAADFYAANLLMPLAMFKAECRQHRRLDLKALKAVAGVFNTSLTATLIRMIDSGNYPTVIMISHGTGGRKWHKLAAGIPGYWRPRDDLDVESFAFELLHNPDSKDEGFPRKIGADAWFDNWSAEKYVITEQSLRIRGEGVVTILDLDPKMIP
ncbi:ImmA/IrrE family metallo-endopeptidase [Rhizobium ruizarguesonis]|uniref:ImmA/IrrE family metallo-endopeptidase n=1 Tax=Rhizobium ruizarguesonis TaxID=2081791 RepID=UPI00103EFB77|nr:ImmA/IrrE family metallo-endopeptidase [Rhizobium ruizarguesonis]MBY5896717.1 ImmA/IrrE family metallo-endopeptidase [Rhizobium leguminosarum]NEH78132.1 ImmA/IrrE family metallo-endopeptidase [Rhizobium ruizarguesonis]TBY54413.1 ImmA/IrrE family metallo-endopeptidase [Rhizobium leguminosarum bv. viciae]